LLLDALAGKGTLAGVPGLWYRENGAVRSNPPEPGPLEDVPLPDFDGLPLEGYRQEVFEASPFLPYQTSRGCPGNCAFCTFSRVHFGRALESKSPAKVVSELKEYSARYGSRYFSMCDECFNNIPEKAAAICDAIAAAGLGLRWEAFVRFNTLDEALLRKMKAAGCALIKVGIESGSDRVLAAMRKGLTAAQAQKAIELCRAAGIKVRAYFIIGYPGETDADVDATIAFIERNAAAIDSFSLYRFRVEYPSEIWAAPEKFGLEDLKMRHPHFQYGEAGGRRWPELARDKNRSLARVMKAVYGKVLAGRYRVGPLPLLAFLLCEKLCDIGRGGAWRWLPRWALDAVYTLDPRYFDGTMGRYAAYVTRDLFPFSRSDAKKSGGVFPLLDPGPE
ncbi:MAG: B12-binding domain-containing radical SAM protein, partial [Elusimicrobiales bacterium]|nr:B12-binding domain-containing radical SAM protein [Elusimicrobiales bacterium]